MPTPFFSSRAVRRCAYAIGLILLLLPAATLAQVCDTPNFDPSVPFKPIADIIGTPTAQVAGTFYKHEGETGCDCDLAVAVAEFDDPNKDFLVILRGENNGAFVRRAENPILEIGDNPIGLVGGRFAQDGAGDFDDLVVVTGKGGERGRVAVFVPDANGRYGKLGPDLTVGKAPRGIITGHFNQDSKLDIAVLSNDPDQQLTIFFGDGRGGFSAATPAIVRGVSDRRMWSLAAGKFQGNAGTEDIAIANEDAQGNVRVSIVRRSQAGTFQLLAPTIIAKGSDAQLATGHFSAGGDTFQDLAITYTDTNSRGAAMILNAGAQTTPVRAIANRPKSTIAGDLNNDGHDDLIVASFTATSLVNPDGKITVYKGVSSGTLSFDEKLWETSPSSILPRALVIGRFGRDPATARRDLGLAAANAPELNTISAYIGNGTGIFVAPSGFVTPIRPNAAFVTVGDFHSSDGEGPELDLAYLRPDDAVGEHVLTVLLNNGERTFHEFQGPVVRVGREPLLMAAERFDAGRAYDLVVVDGNPGDSQHRARLRLFRGEGQGKFSRPAGAVDILFAPGEKPVGIATGQFFQTDPHKPSDVAIISKVGTGGTLKLFFNDGSGRFTVKKTDLAFRPEKIVASPKFRDGNIFDVVIKHEASNRFTFFENIGDGSEFVRIESFDDPSADADASGQFIVGDVNADGFDDVVQLDKDRTIDVFLNTGSGRFVFKNVETLAGLQPGFDPASATFFLEDFGAGQLGLVGLVGSNSGKAAIVALKGNPPGCSIGSSSVGSLCFIDPRMDVLQPQPPTGLEFAQRPDHTLFSTGNMAHAQRMNTAAIFASAFSGRFANSLHGNGRSDLGFISLAQKTQVVAGMCATDPQPNPGPIGHCEVDPNCNPGEVIIACPSAECSGPCLPLRPPPQRTCKQRCPKICTSTPQNPFCESKSDGLYVTVFRNTCG